MAAHHKEGEPTGASKVPKEVGGNSHRTSVSSPSWAMRTREQCVLPSIYQGILRGYIAGCLQARARHINTVCNLELFLHEVQKQAEGRTQAGHENKEAPESVWSRTLSSGRLPSPTASFRPWGLTQLPPSLPALSAHHVPQRPTSSKALGILCVPGYNLVTVVCGVGLFVAWGHIR